MDYDNSSWPKLSYTKIIYVHQALTSLPSFQEKTWKYYWITSITESSITEVYFQLDLESVVTSWRKSAESLVSLCLSLSICLIHEIICYLLYTENNYTLYGTETLKAIALFYIYPIYSHMVCCISFSFNQILKLEEKSLCSERNTVSLRILKAKICWMG